MAHLPELHTDRLELRLPGPDDAAAMLAFVTDNREHFASWDPDRPPVYYTLPFWERELEQVAARAREGSGFQFVVLRPGHPAIGGQCTLSGIARGPFQAAYLGYGLDHRWVGKGYMGEALEAVIHFAFSDLNLHRVMANHMPTNLRSARLLRRLGFVVEGYARDYLHLAGDWQDHVLTSLSNPDWRAEGMTTE